jgi:hypothetical protein
MKNKMNYVALIFVFLVALGFASGCPKYSYNQNIVLKDYRIITPNVNTDGLLTILNTGKTNILRISNQEFLMPKNTYSTFWFEEGNYQITNAKSFGLVMVVK